MKISKTKYNELKGTIITCDGSIEGVIKFAKFLTGPLMWFKFISKSQNSKLLSQIIIPSNQRHIIYKYKPFFTT
jgi:hypothetical protein